MGEDFNYAEAFKSLDLEAFEKGSSCTHDRLTGLVAADFGIMAPYLYAWHGIVQALIVWVMGVVVQAQDSSVLPLNSWPR